MAKKEIAELFREEQQTGKTILALDYSSVDYVEPEPDEKDAVRQCVDEQVRVMERVSPELANQYKDHESIFTKFAGVAKAHFPENKPITYPSQTGQIGCLGLIPQAVKYAATADPSNPCYTSYNTNLWTIDLTKGNAAYILGDGSNYYKASSAANKHSLLVIIQDGLIEIGTTPRLQQQRVQSEATSKYGIGTMQPLSELPITPNLTLYQYNTLGVLPVYHDSGVMWGVMPKETGTSEIKLLGMVFFEHDFLSTLTWL